jgi:hypothetical protein
MHQKHPNRNKASGNSHLLSSSANLAEEKRKREHRDPFLSSIPHHPTAADEQWIYGCKGFVKWAAK